MIPKFRGWIKAKKEMHDVLLIDWLNNLVDLAYSNIELDFNDVILMQSTGLKDINGVEIFEGDILEIVYPALIDWDDITNIDKGVVVFKDYELSVRVDDEFLRLKEIEKCIDVEVIGNIYENKKLLED